MNQEEQVLRQPINSFERLLWLHGRKFYLAFFAGTSQFLVTVLAIVAIVYVWNGHAEGTPEELARIITNVVADYLFASAGIVLTYSGSNAVIERAHAKRGNTASPAQPSPHEPSPPSQRMSGMVRSADDAE